MGLLLALGDVKRDPGIGQGGPGAGGEVETRCGAGRLVVADRVALTVGDGRKQLGPEEWFGARIGKDEGVVDLRGQAGAEHARQLAGRRRVQTGGDDRRVVEARLPQIGHGVGVAQLAGLAEHHFEGALFFGSKPG